MWLRKGRQWQAVGSPQSPGGLRGGASLAPTRHPSFPPVITALVEEREPIIDLATSLAITVPGIVAHQSAFKNGEQLKIPSYELL